MSSLLQTPAVEYCHGLRGRRRSSFALPQELFAHIRNGHTALEQPPNPTDSAVVDDVEEISLTTGVHHRSQSSSAPLSPLSRAQVSGHATTVSVPRYHETFLDSPTRPTLVMNTLSGSTVKQDSIIDISSRQTMRAVDAERFYFRLCASYFMYFLCGWGDGGLSNIMWPRSFKLTHCSFSDRHCVALSVFVAYSDCS
jgi:hypothetical protein